MVGSLLQIWRVLLDTNDCGVSIEDVESTMDDIFKRYQKTLFRQQLAMCVAVTLS
jgi:uncharacterized protein Yka (UPF0111/DUF47 family)